MIECENLTVRYGKKEILHSLSFRAEAARITVILGKNGSGKSTLLRALSGLLPFSGKVTAEGKNIRAMRAAERARSISVMPQMLRDPAVTVRDLVAFGRHPYAGFCGILSRDDRKKVGDVLQKTGLSHLADTRLDHVSGGERQKAYFAMLLAQDTPNLLLDEPAAHLDAEYTGALCRFLEEERARGKTILAVLHDVNRALALADRLLVLSGGQAVFDGAPADFAKSPLPADLFGLERLTVTSENAPGAPQVFFR